MTTAIIKTLTPQERQLVQHLGRGFKTTRLTAMHQLNIASITAVVTRLKNKGVELRSDLKFDSHGRRYAEYSLPAKALRYLLTTKQID